MTQDDVVSSDSDLLVCVRCGRSVNESGFKLEIVEGDYVRVRTETFPNERNLWRAHTKIGYYCSVECIARTQVAALQMLSAALPGRDITIADEDTV